VKAEGHRVLVVVGTRPEAIKVAPVLAALRSLESPPEVRLALTGQHTEMVDEVLETFSLVPDWDLELLREGQSLASVGSRCLEGLDRILGEWRPDILLVQGDTASVFFGAMAAYLAGVPVGHIEAGLRTGDLMHPFPEEGFRRLTGVLADLHFAPTERARTNLLAEGIADEKIHVTGNTVVDALLDVQSRGLTPSSPVLRRLCRPDEAPFFLLTAHRRESFGEPLERVFLAVRQLLNDHPGLEIVYPLHPNPAVREPALRALGGIEGIHLVNPLPYPDLVAALAAARGVLTDSGGLQEEAPTFGTPVLVLREKTERPEGIEAGVATLVGTDPLRILEEAGAILGKPRDPSGTDRRESPYGDGRAGSRIAAITHDFLEREGDRRTS